MLITVQNLRTTGTVSVRTNYTLDSQPGKEGIARVAPPVDKFVLKFSSDQRGALTANVLAYTYVSPSECYVASTVASRMLDGSYKQDLEANLPTGVSVPCDASQVPLTLPAAAVTPLASWGDSSTNIWVVGGGGVILHWDGRAFTQIPLPPDLTAAPPTWRAVSGVGNSYVWVAGDGGIIARWDGTQLKTISLVTTTNTPFMPGSLPLPSWVSLAVANQMADDVFFVSSNGYIGRASQAGTTVQAFTTPDTFPVYPVSGNKKSAPMSATVSFNDIYCQANNECWFVGYDPKSFATADQTGAGAIFQAYTFGGGVYSYSDYSMSDTVPASPVTRSRLRGVWGSKFTALMTPRQLYIVGEGGTILFSNNTGISLFEPNLYPKFKLDYSMVASTFLSGSGLALNAIGGSSPTDLWVAGDGGLLMRWDPAPVAPGNPFTVVHTGLTANLTSVFSTTTSTVAGRVYVSGDQQTFAAP